MLTLSSQRNELCTVRWHNLSLSLSLLLSTHFIRFNNSGSKQFSGILARNHTLAHIHTHTPTHQFHSSLAYAHQYPIQQRICHLFYVNVIVVVSVMVAIIDVDGDADDNVCAAV